MSNISILGIDIAKHVFQLYGIDCHGNKVYSNRVKRNKFKETVLSLDADLIAMEACGGANAWARSFMKENRNVKLISPQHVKPYAKRRNKTDKNDARAIAEAASRPHIRSVKVKTVEQQNIQSILRVRERLVKNRTALLNEIHGLLSEYEVPLSKGKARLRFDMLAVMSGEKEMGKLDSTMLGVVHELYEELKGIDHQIKVYEKQLQAISKALNIVQRLMTIPGIGYLTGLALYACVGDASHIERARDMSAYLGLVPSQHSSGEKQCLGRITRTGNKHIRKALVHGARAVMRWQAGESAKKVTAATPWLTGIINRSHHNKACVALANKMARIVWALLRRGGVYDEHLAFASLTAK